MLRISSALANAQATAMAELFNDAELLVYDGKRPANADVPVNGQKLLLRFQFGNPALKDSAMASWLQTTLRAEPAAAISD